MRRTAAVMTALFVAGLACGGGRAPGRTPSGGYVSCSSDDDCTITTFAGCCACCPDPPHAVPAAKLEQQQKRCAAADCGACSQRVDCPRSADVSAFTARCKEGTCAAEPK
jgi:hypothetical protein